MTRPTLVDINELEGLVRPSDRVAVIGRTGSGAGTVASRAVSLVGNGRCRSLCFARSAAGVDADLFVVGAADSASDAEETARQLGLDQDVLRLLPPLRFLVQRPNAPCKDGGHGAFRAPADPVVA